MRLSLCVGLLCAGLSAPALADDYVMIRQEVVVDRPADAVWDRVGGYCDIAEWLDVSCELIAGSGDVGSARRLNGATVEPMVARTDHSYTYWQSVGNMAVASFHGTLAVEPDGSDRSRLSYTIFYDPAGLPSDDVRASERARLDKRFLEPLMVMKRLAEEE